MTETAPPPPAGLKAKANAAGMNAYLKAPPKVQTALLNGYVKGQPVVAKAKPHAPKIVGGLLGLVMLIRLKRRRA